MKAEKAFLGMKYLQRMFLQHAVPALYNPHPSLLYNSFLAWLCLIMTFQCIKNALGKANNFKKQILAMWSYNINCWDGFSAFLSAIAAPAIKVEDKTNILGFWLPPGDKLMQLRASFARKMMLLVFLHPTSLTDTLESFKLKI